MASFFESKAFKVIMARIYGLGAAVVIIGALFKILSWKFANEMLMIGLLTEAGIFAISAFEPMKKEYDWTRVYPELAEVKVEKAAVKGGKKENLVKTLDDMLAEAKIEQNTINRLGESFRSLSENVNRMTTVSDAALATNDYAEKVKVAAQSVNQLNGSYAHAIQAIEKLGQTGDVSTEYYNQVQQVTQKLTSLNSIYEMELQESNNHIRQLNQFIGGLSNAVRNLSDSEEATARLRDEFGRLSSNLTSLNNVYGNMLAAMSTAKA